MSTPTITAMLEDGPVRGRALEVEVVEGRPPKTIDVSDGRQTTWRYCLAKWNQGGPTARYTFLYLV
jgi:hypothetical protein